MNLTTLDIEQWKHVITHYVITENDSLAGILLRAFKINREDLNRQLEQEGLDLGVLERELRDEYRKALKQLIVPINYSFRRFRRRRGLSFVPPHGFKGTVQHILHLMEPLESNHDEPAIQAFCGPSGMGKTRNCIESCFEAAQLYALKHNVDPIILDMDLRNTTTAGMIKTQVTDPVTLVAKSIVGAANDYNQNILATATLTMVQEQLSVLFNDRIPPILLIFDEVHWDHKLAKDLVKGCMEIKRMYMNDETRVLVVPVLAGYNMPNLEPIKLHVETIRGFSGDELLASFVQEIEIDPQCAHSSSELYKLFRFCAESPKMVYHLATGIDFQTGKDGEKFLESLNQGLSAKYVSRLCNYVLNTLSPTYGDGKWNAVMLDKLMPCDHDYVKIEMYRIMAQKSMQLIFCESSLGILIDDLNKPLAPSENGCDYPSYQECADAGLFTVQKCVGGYQIQLPVIGLMVMNRSLKILPIDLNDPYQEASNITDSTGPVSVYLRLKHAQLRGETIMPLSKLRPASTVYGPSDVKLKVPSKLHFKRLECTCNTDDEMISLKRSHPSNENVESGTSKRLLLTHDDNDEDVPATASSSNKRRRHSSIQFTAGVVAVGSPDRNDDFSHLCLLEGVVDSKDTKIILIGRTTRKRSRQTTDDLKQDLNDVATISNVQEDENVVKAFISDSNGKQRKRQRPFYFVHDILMDDSINSFTPSKKRSFIVAEPSNPNKMSGQGLSNLDRKA